MNTVKPLYQRAKTAYYEQISINYIVYERNDDGLLLECEINSNGKKYQTNICIGFQELNRLIGVAARENGIDIYDLISEHIVSSNNSICEVNLEKELGHPLTLMNYSFDSTHHLMRA